MRNFFQLLGNVCADASIENATIHVMSAEVCQCTDRTSRSAYTAKPLRVLGDTQAAKACAKYQSMHIKELGDAGSFTVLHRGADLPGNEFIVTQPVLLAQRWQTRCH